MAPVWLGDRGPSEEFFKISNSWGLPREGTLKFRFDFEIPSRITCRLYFIYSLFKVCIFFPVMPQATKTKHPGRIGLNLNKFSFGTLKVTITL